MLIKLTSNTSGEMIMFAEHAHQLFEIIGKECTATGVFTTEQLPEAIARLHQAVEAEKLVPNTTLRKSTPPKPMMRKRTRPTKNPKKRFPWAGAPYRCCT